MFIPPHIYQVKNFSINSTLRLIKSPCFEGTLEYSFTIRAFLPKKDKDEATNRYYFILILVKS